MGSDPCGSIILALEQKVLSSADPALFPELTEYGSDEVRIELCPFCYGSQGTGLRIEYFQHFCFRRCQLFWRMWCIFFSYADIAPSTTFGIQLPEICQQELASAFPFSSRIGEQLRDTFEITFFSEFIPVCGNMDIFFIFPPSFLKIKCPTTINR
jgi:hypothetical protein